MALKKIIQSNVENLQSSVENTAKGLGSKLANSALDAIGPAGGLLKALLNGPSSMPALKTQIRYLTTSPPLTALKLVA